MYNRPILINKEGSVSMKYEYPKAVSLDSQYNAIPVGYWGNTTPGTTSPGIPIYHLTTANALNQLVGYVKFINGSNGTVLYRGQVEDHGSLLPSGCRPSSTAVSDEVITRICADNDMMKFFKLNDSAIDGWKQYQSVIIESALQHYGANTYCMDFVDNHWCALWFGLYKFNNGRYFKRKDLDGYLYLYMYLADTNGPAVRGMYIGENTYTVDLRKALPSCFSRPSAQHGWIVRPKDRTTYSFDTSVVCVAKISVSDAAKWLGDGDLLSQENFFPDYDIDQAYNVFLQRQKRSGLYSSSNKELILPVKTIENYHIIKSILISPSGPIEEIMPIRSMIKHHTTGIVSNLLDLYKLLLHNGWSKETCAISLRSRWSELNPCLGQSDITALLVQKCFGGDIYHFKYSDRHHYFNKINGLIIDLTFHEAMDAPSSKYDTADKRSEKANPHKSKHRKRMERYELLIQNCQLRLIDIN